MDGPEEIIEYQYLDYQPLCTYMIQITFIGQRRNYYTANASYIIRLPAVVPFCNYHI